MFCILQNEKKKKKKDGFYLECDTDACDAAGAKLGRGVLKFTRFQRKKEKKLEKSWNVNKEKAPQ